MTDEDTSGMYRDALQLIGEPIATMLVEAARQPNDDPNPLLVQVVLQVFMTRVCASKIELWMPNDQKISNVFTNLYAKIVDTEEQATAGQWRALTQKHLTIRVPSSTIGWKEDLISSLMKIFKIAAWRIPDKEECLSFEGKLVPIFEAVEDLRIAIGEKITSADIRLSLVPPNSQFFASRMDDVFCDERVKVAPIRPIQSVIGTTGFGLKMPIPGQRDPKSGELLYGSVFSPKVILESTLKEALDPPSHKSKPVHKPTMPVGGHKAADPSSLQHQKQSDSNWSEPALDSMTCGKDMDI
ncbi:hypothetical protein BJ165DRAFT_1467389 [Panaeolus papilionaceus]|nr:hypothetical protein BJ165DRAFT_1467389 [Panaeolus papilionaceus]